MGGIYLDIKARTELRAKYTREDGNYTPEEKVINALLDTLEEAGDIYDAQFAEVRQDAANSVEAMNSDCQTAWEIALASEAKYRALAALNRAEESVNRLQHLAQKEFWETPMTTAERQQALFDNGRTIFTFGRGKYGTEYGLARAHYNRMFQQHVLCSRHLRLLMVGSLYTPSIPRTRANARYDMLNSICELENQLEERKA